jgi:hypothetical protein
MTEFQTQEEALQAAFAAQNKQDAPVVEEQNKEEAKAPEAKEEQVAAPVTEVKAEEVKVEAAKQEIVEAKVEDTKQETAEVKEKSIDELIAEKTGGKIAKWEDVEKIINAPKEELDEEVKHWNELKKKGIKLDKEFFDLQGLEIEKVGTKEYSGPLDDPRNLMVESLKRKTGLSEDTIRFQMEKKYNLSEWQDKEEADLTIEDKANREIMMVDAEAELNWLKNYKAERTFVKAVDPTEIAKQEAEQKLRQENLEKYIDVELSSKIKNISIVTNEETKEVFDYKLSEAVRTETGNLMKSFAKDGNALFNQYAEKDSQGNVSFNQQKFFVDLVKAKTYDDAVKHAYNDGKAEGEKKFIKEDLKNVDFKQNEGQVNQQAPRTEAEAIAQALIKNNLKIT